MKKCILILNLLCLSHILFANNAPLVQSEHQYYQEAKQELQDMLDGKKPLSFERAIFVIENAYYENTLSYDRFQKVITACTQTIKDIKQSSNQKFVPKKDRTIFEMAQRSDEQIRADFDKTLTNWAIYTYITDTSLFAVNDSLFLVHLPFQYSTKDPMGTNDWTNTHITHLLYSKQGNCFALASLFKIFANRLHSEASLCTAPSHIYISHKDINGTEYNVELSSRTFLGSGTLETLTYTTSDAIKNGISLRELTNQQSVALCLVYLAKGYEHKFGVKDNFMLQCAETILQYDSLNLNALLLKAELLENGVLQKHKTITQLQSDADFKKYEKLLSKLYILGYREMPIDMKNLLVKGWTKDTVEFYLKNYLAKNKDETRKASLSWGLFDEEHKYKPIEQYSQTLLDCKTKKIKEFVKETPIYNDYNFDPVVFAWNVDPLTHETPNWSPYSAFGDNPILYIDEDGQKFVWNKLTTEQTAKLSENLKALRSDKVFDYIYSRLENSKQEYTFEFKPSERKNPAQYVPNGQNQGGTIQFDPNVVLQDEYTLEEFFHAFQDDNKGINNDVSAANIEYEAKLFTFTAQNRLGLPSGQTGGTSESLSNIVFTEFSENLTSKDLQSDKFLKLYAGGIKDFSDYWKTNDPQKSFPGYQATPSSQGPVNLNKATRETEANTSNLVGPRLDNGDFYSN